MTQASAHCWHNGQIVHREQGAPSVASISFHLGTGVFDGFLAEGSRWRDLERLLILLEIARQAESCVGSVQNGDDRLVPDRELSRIARDWRH